MLFEGVKYHLSTSFSGEQKDDFTKVLNANGAELAESVKDATHIITDTPAFEGWRDVSPDAHVVSDFWITRSLALGKQQETRIYSVDPKMIFSGVVVCTTDISGDDKEVISAAVAAGGGMFREGFTRDVTHLLAPSPGSDKYKAAIHHKDDTGVKVVTPHWFDDTFKLNRRVNEEDYEWPDPRILRPEVNGEQTGVTDMTRKRKDMATVMSPQKKSLFRTAVLAVNGTSSRAATPLDIGKGGTDLWGGRRILLSHTLQLEAGRRGTLALAITRAGGEIVQAGDEIEEEEAIDNIEVLITPARSGGAYFKAVRQRKTIGTLAWLFHVHKTGVISRPTDQLLHYPLRPNPIETFDNHLITLTNYTGEARDYLKRLITVMGARFTPEMTGKNTVVIAAFMGGSKTTKAREWSIPIVNHTWLEDCFVQWRNLTFATDQYIRFPPGVNFATLLGEKGVGRTVGEDEGKIATDAKELERIENARPRTLLEMMDGDEPVRPSRYARRTTPLVSPVIPAAALPEVVVPLPVPENDEAPPPPPVMTPSSQRETHEVESIIDEAVARQEHRSTPAAEEGSHRTTVNGNGPSEGSPGPQPPQDESTRDGPRRGHLADSDLSVPPAEASRQTSALPRAERAVKMDTEAPLASPQTAQPEASTSAHPTTDGDISSVINLYNRTTDDNAAGLIPEGGSRHESPLEAPMDIDEDGHGDGAEQPAAHPPNEVVPAAPGRSPADAREPTPPLAPPQSSPLPSSSAPPADDSDVEPQRRATPVHEAAASVLEVPDDPARGHGSSDGQEETTELEPSRAKFKSKSRSRSKAKVTEAQPPSTPEPVAIEAGPSNLVLETPFKIGPPKGMKKTKTSGASTRPIPFVLLPETPPRLRPVASSSRVTIDNLRSTQSPAPSNAKSKHRVQRLGSEDTSLSPTARPAAKGGQASDVIDMDLDEGETISSKGRKRHPSAKAAEMIKNKTVDDETTHSNETRHRKRPSVSLKGPTPGDTIAGSSKEVEAPSDNEGPSEPTGKRRKPTGKKRTSQEPNGEEADSKSAKRRKVDASSNPGGSGAKAARQVKFITTQARLPEKWVEGLIKMGAKQVSDPRQCTHLVAGFLCRTEKFLGAISHAPHIVTENWVIECVKNKAIMPEDDYALADPDNEKKWKVKLADALNRAKNRKDKLLKGHSFYVTPGMRIDLLRMVIESAGGAFSTSPPAARLMTGNWHIVSQPKEKKLWQSFAQQAHTIFTEDFVLNGILRQMMDWQCEDESSRVEGSV